MKLILLIGIVLVSTVYSQRVSYCYSNDDDPYLQFASKTSYEFATKRDNRQHYVPGCQPIMFWSMNRHGARLPGKMSIQELPRLDRIRDDIISNYEVKKTGPDQGRLCDQDLENLKRWYWNRNFTVDRASDLTIQGYEDLKYIAKRWQSRFPDLLPSQYSPRHYLFRHTDKKRARDSFMAFADGLFGREGLANVQSQEASPKDPVLLLNEFCEAWINEVKNNPQTTQQMDTFRKKEEYKTMLLNVSNHLGYRYEQDEKNIKDMYDMCRYDKAWEIQRNSAWCAAFNTKQLKLLEYVEDLKSYYTSGYGHPLNERLGCTPLKDMMDRFTKMIEHPEQDQPKVAVYFTHSKMLLPFLTALKVAKDSVPLLADNYHTQQIERRAWKTALIDPFAANLAAVLHKCQGEYKIMFFLNEKPVDFPDCQVGLCTWNVVKNKYSEAVKKCDIKFCSGNTGSSFAKTYSWIAGLVITILMSKVVY